MFGLISSSINFTSTTRTELASQDVNDTSVCLVPPENGWDFLLCSHILEEV